MNEYLVIDAEGFVQRSTDDFDDAKLWAINIGGVVQHVVFGMAYDARDKA